jgi:hypothetical protein
MGMNVNNMGGDLVILGTSDAGAADNAVLYTSPDVSKFNYHIIDNRSGESVDVWVSIDGTNYSQTAASVRLIDDVTTGDGVNVIDIATTKTGILRGKFRNVRILQKGAGNPAAGEIVIAHGVE